MNRRIRLAQLFAFIALFLADIALSRTMGDPLPALRAELRYLTPIYIGSGDLSVDARRYMTWRPIREQMK